MSLVSLSAVTAADTRFQVSVNPDFVAAVETLQGRDGARAIVRLAEGTSYRVAETYHDVIERLDAPKRS